jgi:hypothetical protein
LGYDYVHAAVDDHSRLAYAEVLADEKGTTCAGFLLRAAVWFAEHGITAVTRVLTDNAKNYVISREFAAAAATVGARHKTIKPHCHRQHGTHHRANVLAGVLQHPTRSHRTQRPPTHQPHTDTNVTATYT